MKRLGTILVVILATAWVLEGQSKVLTTYNNVSKAATILSAPVCTERSTHTWDCFVKTQINAENRKTLKLKAVATFDDGSRETLHSVLINEGPKHEDLGPFQVGQTIERAGFFAFAHEDNSMKSRPLTKFYVEVED